MFGGWTSAAADDSAPSDTTPLRWAADAEGGAPHIFKDPKAPEGHVGFEVELADALAKQLGRPIQFVQYNFASLIPGLRRGDFELAMNGLEITPDRKLPTFAVAVVGFGLNYAAYESEIYRAGIAAVPIGQWEAAASLGMSCGLTFRRIIFPQAVRIILPPMTNDFIALLKDTSLVSVISVVELTKQYQMLAKPNSQYAEIGALTALLYLAMSVPLGYLSRWLEKRAGKGAA